MHAARLKTGEDVVLKVRKPGVEKVIVTDLNLLYLVARVAERVTPGAAHASLAAIVGTEDVALDDLSLDADPILNLAAEGTGSSSPSDP